jgi:hypothetical protein
MALDVEEEVAYLVPMLYKFFSWSLTVGENKLIMGHGQFFRIVITFSCKDQAWAR